MDARACRGFGREWSLWLRWRRGKVVVGPFRRDRRNRHADGPGYGGYDRRWGVRSKMDLIGQPDGISDLLGGRLRIETVEGVEKIMDRPVVGPHDAVQELPHLTVPNATCRVAC